MNKLLTNLFFSRLLTSIIIANFISLVVLNLFNLPAKAAVAIYLPALLASFWTLWRFRLRKQIHSIDKGSLLIVVVTLILLSLPRLSYFTEWIAGNEVRVIADDFARMAELISMTLTDQYPLQHPANQEYLLSFYYTSLYPFALLKFMLPFLTLKDSIAIGNLFYQALILLSLVELAHLLLDNAGSISIFVFLCTLFGGLDWLYQPLVINGYFEWWQRAVFDANTQISSFFTGLFWVIHHFIAFYALVLTFVVTYRMSAPRKELKFATALLLLASALYSSPFSFLPAILFGLAHITVIRGKFLRSWVFPIVLVAALIPAFIFFGRLTSQRFVASTFRVSFSGQFWIDKLLSAPVYFALVPLVEFSAIPFLLLFVYKRMTRVEKQYLLTAYGFFGLTYFVAYTGSNNFAMRGMFLPSLVFFYLFAKYYRHIRLMNQISQWKGPFFSAAVAVVVIMTSLGALKTVGATLRSAAENNRLTYQLLEREQPEWLMIEYRDLARDSLRLTYQPTEADRFTKHKYNAEKLIDSLAIEEMANWEQEILRLPREGFFK
jgi:hypothetical protein